METGREEGSFHLWVYVTNDEKDDPPKKDKESQEDPVETLRDITKESGGDRSRLYDMFWWMFEVNLKT